MSQPATNAVGAATGRGSDEPLAHACTRAISFLLKAREADGWWRDFDTLAGPSDEWVTAYIGLALARDREARCGTVAREAYALLARRRRWSGGWGYNARVPADADSTLWALALAASLGEGATLRTRRANRFLHRHVRPDGGIATYAVPRAIRRFTGLANGTSFDGWCSTHVCVTCAAAAFAPSLRPEVLGFTRRAQERDGGWSGYWWPDRAYPTALAVLALARRGGDEARGAASSGAAALRRWIGPTGAVVSRTNPEGSPFATASAVLGAAASATPADSRAPIDRGVAWLLEQQHDDGSWAPSAALRVPPPDLVDPDRRPTWVLGGRGGGSINVDGRRVYTTATALLALRAAGDR